MTQADDFTLHVVEDVRHLRALSSSMANCLDTYTRRFRGRHRIVEVRCHGRTRYAVHIHDGRIMTFEAAENRPPDPADVLPVRQLLERKGHLAATLTLAQAARPRGSGHGRTSRETAARRQAAATTAPPALSTPAGISVQQLATDLLARQTLDSADWTEVAAAFWSVGLLAQLPSPTQPVFERVVRDLALRVATGDMEGSATVAAPTDAERAQAARRLLDSPRATWQHRRMADVLFASLRP